MNVRLFLALSVAIVAGALFWSARTPTTESRQRTPPQCDTFAAAHEATPTSVTGASARRDPIQAAVASVSAPSFLRMSVRDAFPEIPAGMRDWREFQPERLRVEPVRGMPLDFTRTALKDDGRLVTWIGRIAAVPGASWVSVARADGFDAVMVIPGASQFSFHVRGDSVVVEESAPGEEGCGVDPIQPDRPSPAAASPALYRASQASTDAMDDLVAEAQAASSAPNVDVLFLYDADSLSHATERSTDPIGYLEGRSRATLETANLVLQQSGVTAFAWRWIGLEASQPYTRTGILIDDLRQVSPGGAIGEFVSGLRYKYGADQVMLFIGGNTDAGGWANIATKQSPVTGSFACTVMRVNGSYKLMAHELAHNFGCRHDRANFGGTGVSTPEGDGFWCYGLLWTDPAIVGGNTTSGTIMSYANYIVPYFSNPNIMLDVTTAMEERSGPNLALGTQTIGYPETHAKAAYNTRVLNDNAAVIVAVNAELAMPRIVTQPQGTSVATGSALRLSVTVDGGGLFYQWSRNGQAIAGATAANYTQSSATNTDAGDYSVQVSNRMGTVTSSSATVAITAAPAPAPTPSSSGGGGGGGASTAPFVGMVALLLVSRAARRLRTG